MEQEYQKKESECEQEWISKYDIFSGKIKESLSVQCGNWVMQNKERTDKIIKEQIRLKLAECYDKIIELAKEYIDMDDKYYHLLATWIIGTYYHDEFEAYPILFLNAIRGGAKTRTEKFISSLSKNGDGSVLNNLTEAVLFRIPKGTTTCIDEVEQISSKEKATLKELLNSCYKKGMKVKRMKKIKLQGGSEQQVVESFEPYFPLVLANINGLDEVLSDRSITLVLEKSNNPLMTKKIEDFDKDEFLHIKRTLEQVSVVSEVKCSQKTIKKAWNNYINMKYTNYTNYTTTYNTLTTPITLEDINLDEMFNKIDELGITGRNFELLLPLLLVNKMISNEYFERFLVIGKEIMVKKKEEEYSDSKDVQLYDFVGTWLQQGSQFLPIKQLVSEFRMFVGEGEQEDRWLNERWLGKALKRLNLIIDRRRLSTGMEVTLNHIKAKDKLKIFREEKK